MDVARPQVLPDFVCDFLPGRTSSILGDLRGPGALRHRPKVAGASHLMTFFIWIPLFSHISNRRFLEQQLGAEDHVGDPNEAPLPP